MAREMTPIGFVIRIVMVAVLGLVGLLFLVQAVTPRPGPPLGGIGTLRLADGSFVSVQQVSVGTAHEWQPPERRTMTDWLLKRGPVPKQRYGTSPARMLVWVARHDGESNQARVWPEVRFVRLDVAGQTVYADRYIKFRRQPPGGHVSTSSSDPPVRPEPEDRTLIGPRSGMVYGFEFPLVPAGSGPLRLTFLGEGVGEGAAPVELGRVEVAEPVGLNARPGWVGQKLPATSTMGEAVLTLTALRAGGSSYSSNNPYSTRHHFNFDVAMTVRGEPVETQIVEYGELEDSAGNRYDRGYRNGVPLVFGPHKFSLKAQVPTPEAERAGSVGMSAGLVIPGENERRAESGEVSLREGRVVIRCVAMGGKGKVVHPDATPGGAMQWGYHGGMENDRFVANRDSSATGSGGAKQLRMESSTLVHLVYTAPKLGEREWLRVRRVRDEAGRELKFQDFLHHETRMVICRPEEGSRGIVVEWEVIDVEWFEFVIDPPEVK
jgi:hypothetical protein